LVAKSRQRLTCLPQRQVRYCGFKMASHSLVRESHQEQTPPRIRIVHVFGSRADFLGAVPKRPNFSAHVLAVDKGHLTHVLVTPTNPPSELNAH
jgi:hypothetical protein